MCKPATDVFPATQYPDSLARAEILEREITGLCAQINAAGYRLLQLIAELDDQDPRGAWGLHSCAHWLNWRCGIGLNAAREKVRAAHALKALPAISSEFECGRLSFSKVRALTRIADGTNEAELLELALHATAADVEKLVRGYRRAGRLAEAEQAMARHAARELNYYHDDDGCSELECGQRLAPDTVRRIACDGSLIRITEDGDGNPLDIGRKTRAVPPAMQRALQPKRSLRSRAGPRFRDGGCRFPGCTRHRFVDAHHIQHWANGGETSLDNLVLLCRHHHRLVHEGGFGVERIEDGTLQFTRPDGRVIAQHPRLPATGCIEVFHDSIPGKGEPPIDASDWIVPEGVMNLDLAVGGLMQFAETKPCRVEKPSLGNLGHIQQLPG